MITIKVDKSQVMPSDYSMFISFPYNETILNIVRNFRDRAWIKESKQWEVPLSALDVVLDAFSKYDIEIYGTYVDLSPREEVTDINFDFKTKPFEHQKEAFLFGLNHDKWFLGDDQGLGKTKQAIDIAVDMKQERGYKHCLIICGVNSLKWNWRNEVSIHSDETAYILGQRTKKRTGEIYIGSNKDKLADIQALESNSSYFIITNVESLRDDNILSYLVKSVESNLIPMIVVDEFHKCLAYDTPIFTDAGYIRIGDIVENQLNVKVYSFNEQTNSIELKSIKDWHENLIASPMIKLKFQTDRGIKEIRCTPDHKFLTSNRGWVEAKDLTDIDDIVEFNL